jgi:hypothetical protein
VPPKREFQRKLACLADSPKAEDPADERPSERWQEVVEPKISIMSTKKSLSCRGRHGKSRRPEGVLAGDRISRKFRFDEA